MELNCEFINTFTFIIEMELDAGHSSIFHCTVLYLHTCIHILQLPGKLILHLSLSEAFRLVLRKIHQVFMPKSSKHQENIFSNSSHEQALK